MSNYRIISYVFNILGMSYIFSMLAMIFSNSNKTLTVVNELQLANEKIDEENIQSVLIEPIIEKKTKDSKPKEWLMKLKNMKFPKKNKKIGV